MRPRPRGARRRRCFAAFGKPASSESFLPDAHNIKLCLFTSSIRLPQVGGSIAVSHHFKCAAWLTPAACRLAVHCTAHAQIKPSPSSLVRKGDLQAVLASRGRRHSCPCRRAGQDDHQCECRAGCVRLPICSSTHGITRGDRGAGPGRRHHTQVFRLPSPPPTLAVPPSSLFT